MTQTTNKQQELERDATLGITSEEAVSAIGNRYDLILVGARRARELSRGDAPRVSGRKRSHVLTALKEIEEGKVGRDYLYKEQDIAPRRRYRE